MVSTSHVCSSSESGDAVIVVALVCVADRRHRGRREVHRVDRRGVVLERVVVRDVVDHCRPADVLVLFAAHLGRRGRLALPGDVPVVKASLEPAPADMPFPVFVG